MHKKLLLWLFALVAAVPLAAQDYGYLTLKRTDGREKSFAVGRITLTFDATNMQLTTGGQAYSYALTDLDYLFFSSAATAIERVATPAQAVSLEGADLLNVTLPTAARVSVFAVDGTLCLQRSLTAGTHSLPLGGLSRGIYLVRLNGTTFKINKP